MEAPFKMGGVNIKRKGIWFVKVQENQINAASIGNLYPRLRGRVKNWLKPHTPKPTIKLPIKFPMVAERMNPLHLGQL